MRCAAPQGASASHPVCVQVLGVEESVSAAQCSVPISGSWVGGRLSALLPWHSLTWLLKEERERETC